MNNINDFKDIFQRDLGQKQIGAVTQVNTGSILFLDFQGRTYMASAPSDLDLKVNDTVIVVNEVVVGITEVESEPNVFIV